MRNALKKTLIVCFYKNKVTYVSLKNFYSELPIKYTKTKFPDLDAVICQNHLESVHILAGKSFAKIENMENRNCLSFP